MEKRSPGELNPSNVPLLKKAEELRIHLLREEGIREKVSLRAHELYERRGGEPGHAFQDWVQAENEVLSPLIEQELKRSRETSKGGGQKRDANETAMPEIKVVPEKKLISGGIQKSGAARATKTKQTSAKPKTGS
ncbi:MAG: hypothetical protein A3G20_04015 [Acidobacteria bacterium RIFCSPLOWO2_12_FULL_59_11]|nr:MAG: hypothetical protein A3G20_04015 [Acidobacteria bacterium RIFCSPLOWO2_12_FULL_59_11]